MVLKSQYWRGGIIRLKRLNVLEYHFTWSNVKLQKYAGLLIKLYNNTYLFRTDSPKKSHQDSFNKCFNDNGLRCCYIIFAITVKLSPLLSCTILQKDGKFWTSSSASHVTSTEKDIANIYIFLIDEYYFWGCCLTLRLPLCWKSDTGK